MLLGIGLLGPRPSRHLPNVIKQLTSSKHTQIHTRTRTHTACMGKHY